MNKNWGDRADKDLFFTILSVKNIGVISGSEWTTIGNHMRTLGYGFTNEGCRQHFQGLRRAQHKAESNGFSGEKPRQGDPTLNPITRRPGPGRGRPKRIPPVPIAREPGQLDSAQPQPVQTHPTQIPMQVPTQNQDHALDAVTAAAVASLAAATAALPDPQQQHSLPEAIPLDQQHSHPSSPPAAAAVSLPPAPAPAPAHAPAPGHSGEVPEEQHLTPTEAPTETPISEDVPDHSPVPTNDANSLEMGIDEDDVGDEEQPTKRQRLDDSAEDLDNSAGMALDDRNVDPMIHDHDDLPQ
ncbi:hypothetical protein PFICI_09359 [Pestalotiopsis fici W106-1]|uniref:Myb-like domain-containing protein n=1 Tax=Pestalotiopsis fici (strain W106-1 / CGMCC3.15140) TaxID=1229662 RepID=W3X2X9_PESFW|nr:uncharacterized protein PFICI_09359 [Pestalotiopsis fici W106-1]ETS79506.1 hypothetical protein PFICI_09359 [Pestalotiopsis fici W106-1]